MLLRLTDRTREVTGPPAEASEEGDSQVRLRGYTDRLQTLGICSEMAEEFSLSYREDIIRDQRVLRKLQRSLTAHIRELRAAFSSRWN